MSTAVLDRLHALRLDPAHVRARGTAVGAQGVAVGHARHPVGGPGHIVARSVLGDDLRMLQEVQEELGHDLRRWAVWVRACGLR